MRLGLVQFAPKLKDVAANIAKAESLCSKLEPGSIDLLCFPEMIFTGYVFKDGPDIQPYLEPKDSGPTFAFCSSLAKRMGCFVIAGFPEVLNELEEREPHQVGANSAMIIYPSGQLFAVYRKTNLFESDLPWAKPGTGFLAIDLPEPVNMKVALGICNDLNPTALLSPQTEPPKTSENIPYELADFAKENEVDCLIILCAWLATGQEEVDPAEKPMPDSRTIWYWKYRLGPLFEGEESDDPDSETPKPLSIIICNRGGCDYDKYFAGSSTVMKVTGSDRDVDFIGVLVRDAEKCLRLSL